MPPNRLTATASISVANVAITSAVETGTAHMTRVVPVDQNYSMDVLQLTKEVERDIRIELSLCAQALMNQDIRVDGEVRLYDGTGLLAGEADDETLFTVLAPKFRLTAYTVVVQKGDTKNEIATVVITLNNSPWRPRWEQMQTIRRRLSIATLLYAAEREKMKVDSDSVTDSSRTAVVTSNEPAEVISLEKQLTASSKAIILLTAIVLSNGDIRIDGDAKLYSRDEHSRQQLDGQRLFTVLVPREQHTARMIILRNEHVTRQKGGDFVTATFNFMNHAI